MHKSELLIDRCSGADRRSGCCPSVCSRGVCIPKIINPIVFAVLNAVLGKSRLGSADNADAR